MLDEPVSPFLFDLFLYAIRTTAGSDLLRVKGLIASQDDPERPVVLHGVQHLVHTIDRLDHWPSADRRTRIVLIGREVNVEALRSVLTNPSQQGLGNAFFGQTAQAPASEKS